MISVTYNTLCIIHKKVPARLLRLIKSPFDQRDYFDRIARSLFRHINVTIAKKMKCQS